VATETLGVIFDMDGVLVDSYEAHHESWVRMAHEIGRSLTPEQFHATFGRTSREIIEHHWGRGALSDSEIREFDDRKEALYREIVAAAFPVMDGAAELISALEMAGFRLAVGSSGPPENVSLAIERLGCERQFHARVTGRDVRRGKPDPEVFVVAAQRIGIPPIRCAVIEDAPAGIAAANAAGALSVGFLSTGHVEADATQAHKVIRSLRELSPDLLAEWIRARAG